MKCGPISLSISALLITTVHPKGQKEAIIAVSLSSVPQTKLILNFDPPGVKSYVSFKTV